MTTRSGRKRRALFGLADAAKHPKESTPGRDDLSLVPTGMTSINRKNEALVSDLNDLLTSIHIPLTLVCPTDLTPSLLMAILKCLLRRDIPIPFDRTLPHAKIQSMKMFLGILDNDVLRVHNIDVGLSDVDPRRLANGEWDECVFIGELLCWLAKNVDVAETTAAQGEEAIPIVNIRGNIRTPSPSTRSTVTNSVNTNLSMNSFRRNTDSDTSIASSSRSGEFPPQRQRPRCIHELDDSPFQVSSAPSPPRGGHTNLSHASNIASPVPVRHTGWIIPVNVEEEVESFELGKDHSHSSRQSRTKKRKQKIPSYPQDEQSFTLSPV